MANDKKIKEFYKKLAMSHFMVVDRPNYIMQSVFTINFMDQEKLSGLTLKQIVDTGRISNTKHMIDNSGDEVQELLFKRRFISFPYFIQTIKWILDNMDLENGYKKMLWKLILAFNTLMIEKIDMYDEKTYDELNPEDFAVQIPNNISREELQKLQKIKFGNIPVIYVEDEKIYFLFGNHYEYLLEHVFSGISGNKFEEMVEKLFTDNGYKSFGSQEYSVKKMKGEVDHLFIKDRKLIVVESKSTRDYFDIEKYPEKAAESFKDAILKSVQQLKKDKKYIETILKNAGISTTEYDEVVYLSANILRPKVSQRNLKEFTNEFDGFEFVISDIESIAFSLRCDSGFLGRYAKFSLYHDSHDMNDLYAAELLGLEWATISDLIKVMELISGDSRKVNNDEFQNRLCESFGMKLKTSIAKIKIK